MLFKTLSFAGANPAVTQAAAQKTLVTAKRYVPSTPASITQTSPAELGTSSWIGRAFVTWATAGQVLP